MTGDEPRCAHRARPLGDPRRRRRRPCRDPLGRRRDAGAGRPSGEGTSSFALVDTRLAAPTRTFALRGRFDFDALAPDGSVVYLVQHRGAGVYWVRAYDMATRRLRAGAIVEKGEADPDMTGAPVAREVAPGGSVVYTLYRGGDDGAFVHALHTDAGVALCVDLPGAGAGRLQWAGGRLYAIDGARRVVVS